MNHLMKGLGPAPQFILFCALNLTCIGLGTIVAMAVGTSVFGIPLAELAAVVGNPEADHAKALIWMNNITQLIGFAMPVALYLLLFGTSKVHGLMLKSGNSVMMLAPLVILAATPLIDFSAAINRALIPAGSWLESMFKPTEDLAEQITRMFLNPQSGVSMGVAFLSIAIIPSFCEEFVFRGVLMPLLGKMTRNIHLSIWITAILFSLIHAQFYGFLPRMFMGALLGYLVIWSGSLWSSILAHFINNAAAFFLFQYYGTLETPEGSWLGSAWFYSLGSVIFIALITLCIKRSSWPWSSFEYLGMPDVIGKH